MELMVKEAALAILNQTLKFGDPEQIRAVRSLELIAEREEGEDG